MRDYEVFEADLFALTGLSEASEEDRVTFVQEFGRLLGLAGIILAGEQLSEKDQGIYGRLLESQEAERAMAFLVSRDIDMEDVTTNEVIRIKRAVIESGRQMESAFDLLLALKAQLPLTVLEADIVELSTSLNEVQEYTETLPISEEQKAWTVNHIKESADRNVMDYMGDLVPSDVIQRVEQFIDEDKWGEAFQLLLSHGFDYVQAMAEEMRSELSSFKERVSPLFTDVPPGDQKDQSRR